MDTKNTNIWFLCKTNLSWKAFAGLGNVAGKGLKWQCASDDFSNITIANLFIFINLNFTDMKSIKLNKLNMNQLSREQLSAIKGGEAPGYNCSCGCCYVNQGGSNSSDNLIKNYDGGLHTRCEEITGVM